MSRLLSELKRRNVFRVATAYAVIAWGAAQVLDLVTENFGAPEWVMKTVLMLLLIGLPLALFLSWAYELTPDGIKKSDDVPLDESIAPRTGRTLNIVTAMALVLALSFIAWDKLGPRPETPASAVTDKSVAVLPFADLSQSQDQAWFADGLTEEILNALARLPELKVTARTSSFEFKDTNIDISEIAERLGVAHVVEGSVRRIDDRLRVTAQLIRASDGFHLWSSTYDRTSDDLFDVQQDVAENIAATLDVFLDDAARNRMLASGTRDVRAFATFLEGRDIFFRAHARDVNDDSTLSEANQYFDRALQIDPEYVAAYLFHSDRFAHFLLEGVSDIVGDPGELTDTIAFARLRADYQKAMDYATDDGTRLLADLNREFFATNWHRLPVLVEEIETLASKGTVRPDSIWLHEMLIMLDKLEFASYINAERIQHDPLNAQASQDKIDIEIAAGDFAAARATINEERRRFGDHPSLRERDVALAVVSGDRTQLHELFREMQELPRDYGSAVALRAALRGDIDEAKALLEQTRSLHGIPLWAIWTMLELGDEEQVAKLVHDIDATQAGHVNLALTYAVGGKLLWFDLDDTPNFKQRLQEAGVDIESMPRGRWPSASPGS